MKKLLFLGATALVMSASSAFAYTNEAAGYSINNKTPDFIMESANIYGYMNKADKNLHTISCFNAKDMETVIGKKFTTAVFEESYAKLAVLDKNELDKSILNLPILDFARYGKLEGSDKALLESNMEKLKEKVKPEIRLDKIGGKKVITLNVLYKVKGELVSGNTSFLSANDNVYLLASGEILEQADKNKPVASVAEKTKAELEAVDRSTIDPAILNSFWQHHAASVKAVKFLPPVKNSRPIVAYTDTISAKKVVLPKDWGYIQYNHQDKKNPGVLNVAIPTKTLKDIGTMMIDEKVMEKAKTSSNQQDLAKKIGEEALECVEQVFVTGSVKINQDKDLAEMLANPLVTKLQADMFFKEGLKRLKELGGTYIKVNDYKYKSDFAVNKGAIDVLLDLTVMDKVNFLQNIKLTGTPEKGSGLLFLTKKGIQPDTTLKTVYDKWGF